MTFSIAIVGRPNVGKSTLFNRLIGRKLALVDDQPGVTRDLREGETKVRNAKVKIMDTAGLETASEHSLQYRMSALSISAIKDADACLFVVDARVGITAADQSYAATVRKTSKEVILVANKAEGRAAESGIYESFSLGLGEPVSISAEHGIGIDELKEKIVKLFKFSQNHGVFGFDDNSILTSDEKLYKTIHNRDADFSSSSNEEIQISIIGRPNSGKSTLINKIAGNKRLLTGPEAGITRDAISSSINWRGQRFRIFDTAGMRKKAKIQNRLEKLSVSDGIRAIRFSEIVVLLLDVNSPFDTQDLKIADLAEREGRCVVVAVNKWDLEISKNKKILELRKKLCNLLPQLLGVPLVTISGLSGVGLPNLHKQVLLAYEVWNTRITTSRLNNWLADKISLHPPPSVRGKRIRMRYITQVKSRPPSFVIFTSLPDNVPESYKRYLVNGLRKDFGIMGVPIRLMLRTGNNPYDDKSKKRRLIS
ncbi:MAG: ribosome biogenesis GTPase Der [Paracoccaceae bacterium]|nr:ribosome biogenesis GTPase Der [Paracoccaceae bacterium]